MTTTLTMTQISLEAKIKTIWAEVLQLEETGLSRKDNFFLLGGDSLLMAQIMVRLQGLLSVKLTLSELFQLSSISKMAAYCHAQKNTHAYPASAAQCGLWYLQQVQGQMYNSSVELIFEGELDYKSLQQALNAVVLKHGGLRSNFHFDWKSRQLSVKESEFYSKELAVIEVDERSLANKIEVFGEQVFDLENDSLFRVTLFRLSKSKHVLLFCIHHIITDGWSGGIFLRDLQGYYKEYLHRRRCSVLPLNPQYSEYCQWQAKQLNINAFEKDKQFWGKALQGLPADRTYLEKISGAQRKFSYCLELGFKIEGELFKSLKNIAASESASLFMLNLTVFKVVLSLHSGKQDIVLGIPVSNRRYARWEKVLGYFVNLLVLRDKVDPENSFQAQLEQIKLSVLAAFQHQELPFQEVVGLFRKEESHCLNPLFDILFAYQNSPSTKPDFPGLEVTVNNIQNTYCHYDLSLKVMEESDGLNYRLEYACELFTEKTIQNLLDDYQRLLAAIVFKPAQALGKL